MLELAHFQQGSEANHMIEEAASKFKEALKINPKKPRCSLVPRQRLHLSGRLRYK